MTTLTKDLLRTLPPEQQAALAHVEVQRIRVRQQILERARHYRGMNVVAGLLQGAAGGLAIFSVVDPRALLFAVIVATAFTAFQAAGLNRRLGALLDLLDHDSKNEGRSE